jgi:hypothetical protein
MYVFDVGLVQFLWQEIDTHLQGLIRKVLYRFFIGKLKVKIVKPISFQ